ncbi:MAG: amino acid adenylation domain-containing protein [Polyangiaceae bacterium]
MSESEVDSQASTEDEEFAFPASFAQRRLWYLDQIESGTAVYNIPQAFRLKGRLDADVMEKSLAEIVARHESLRTTFEAEEGTPLQIVKAKLPLSLERIDLRDRGEGAFAEAEAGANERARRGFSLSEGPLITATLFQLGDEDHVLYLNVHHIICDGWSLALLFAELSKLYAAFAEGKASPLPDQEIQYADYAIWQGEAFQGEELDKELGFWKDYLGGELPQLSLPFDFNRPAEASLKGRLVRFGLDEDEAEAVKALAKQEKASLFMTLMTAFATFLARITGEHDVLIGSPIANRDREEIRDAIGFYTNTVVFRNDVSGTPSFRELLGRARQNVLGVLAHQELPLEHVVQAINPDRRSGDNPLFQVMFAVQQAPESALSLPGIAVSPVDVHSATSKFDLLLEMQELSEGMQCFFEYATDLFEHETAERLVASFKQVLLGLVREPDLPVSKVPLIDEATRKQLLEDFNATAVDYPRDRCVHQLFAEQAAARPDKIAVRVKDESITYGELDARANRLAQRLRALGVGPDTMVGVFTERSVDMMVAILGAQKAGGAYLPLDPLFPSDRIAYMVEDAKAPVLLTQARLTDELPELPEGTTVIRLDADWGSIAELPAEAPTSDVTPENLAYMIYTSGSTGKPKGVQIPHRAVVNFLSTMAKEPGIDESDVLLAVTTLSFDISVLELMLPLTQGATVAIATHDEAIEGHDLLARIAATGATMMQATPATWRLMIEAGWEAGTTLKRVLCGGEAWPAGLARELSARTGEVWNMYGPTETTIWSTCSKITDPDDVVIGKPIGNTQTYVVDRGFELVPPGVAGELLIGGDGLARGYHQRPELTADRFIDNPFGEGRLYRTGDLVKQRPDGSIKYLERLDNQVKVRGYRIELGEIEAVLEKHPAVKQPVVIVWDGGDGDKRLAAYVVYEEGQSLTSSELRKFLRGDLPDYMIPQLFVEMEELPLTANGKVNRRALPDPLKQGQADAQKFAPPASDAEKLVAGIWREVLHLEREIGLYDNFFDLGGHSLLSAQVMFRIEKQTGHRLSPRAMVFQNLAQLAAELPGGGESKGEADTRTPPETTTPEKPAPEKPAPPPPREEPPKTAEPADKPLGRWLLDKVKKRLGR